MINTYAKCKRMIFVFFSEYKHTSSPSVPDEWLKSSPTPSYYICSPSSLQNQQCHYKLQRHRPVNCVPIYLSRFKKLKLPVFRAGDHVTSVTANGCINDLKRYLLFLERSFKIRFSFIDHVPGNQIPIPSIYNFHYCSLLF